MLFVRSDLIDSVRAWIEQIPVDRSDEQAAEEAELHKAASKTRKKVSKEHGIGRRVDHHFCWTCGVTACVDMLMSRAMGRDSTWHPGPSWAPGTAVRPTTQSPSRH